MFSIKLIFKGKSALSLLGRENLQGEYNYFLRKFKFTLGLAVFLISCLFMVGCLSNKPAAGLGYSNVNIISQISTYGTELSKVDVGKYFCYNLTDYFNSYNFYKISSEIYYDKQRQRDVSIARVSKQGGIYNVEYVGSAGSYVVSFSNQRFPRAEHITSFRRGTILGDAIRDKIYDTFSAWVRRQEIALKANNNSDLFLGELEVAVEVEKWVSSFDNTENRDRSSSGRRL